MSTATVTLCECVGNINNLGVPNCLPTLGAPRRFWFGQVNKEVDKLHKKLQKIDEHILDKFDTLKENYDVEAG